MLPEVGSISRLMWRTMVDLPEPDSPMTQKISPRGTSNEQSAIPTTHSNCSSTCALVRPSCAIARIACSTCAPNIFQTPYKLMTGSLNR